MVGWSVGRSVGRLVGWFVGWLNGLVKRLFRLSLSLLVLLCFVLFGMCMIHAYIIYTDAPCAFRHDLGISDVNSY